MHARKPDESHQSPLWNRAAVRGARGILINITGVAPFGTPGSTTTCSLIGKRATENDDVQINSAGVEEYMGDEVKIIRPSPPVRSRKPAEHRK